MKKTNFMRNCIKNILRIYTIVIFIIIQFYFVAASNTARRPQLTETNYFFFLLASNIENVIREKMRLIQMLHIELPSQRQNNTI